HRYCGDDDIIVGMAEHGRAEERFERTVGYFVNMLPIRSRDLGQSRFDDFLHRLQLDCADALDHAAYPFPAMVRDRGVTPADGAAPIFQIGFEYQNAFARSDLPAFRQAIQGGLAVRFVDDIVQTGEYE